MEFDWQSLGKQVHSSWGDSQMNLPLGGMEQRPDSIIKSCRTSHSQMVPLEEDAGLGGSLIRAQSQREENNQLQQYNAKLLAIIQTLKSEVTRLTAEILEKDGRLKYHADRSAENRRQMERLQERLDKKDEQLREISGELQTERSSLVNLREQNTRLCSEIDRLKRGSGDLRAHVPPIRLHSPRTNRKEVRLALSDINSDGKLRLPEQQPHEDDETNFFEISNYTESDSMKKDVVNTTPQKANEGGRQEDTPIGHCKPGGSSNQSFGLLIGTVNLQAENKRLQKRIADLSQALTTCQSLLLEMEKKSRALQTYYEQNIAKLKLKIDMMRR